jgi:hypothetical protein
MQDEAFLAAQVQRAALFSAFAKATDMEKSLVRAVTPVVSVTRLVYSGHGQFSYRGHAIGLTNNGLQVALNLTPGHVPRSVCVWGPSLLAVFIIRYVRVSEWLKYFFLHFGFHIHGTWGLGGLGLRFPASSTN